MATTRKRFNPKGAVRGDKFAYAEFIAAVLDGTIVATKLVESRDTPAQGNAIKLEYDDPNG